MNSIKTCADLNRYVGSFALIRDLSAVLTLISTLGLLPVGVIVGGSSAALAENARSNAQYVFDKLCTSGGVR